MEWLWSAGKHGNVLFISSFSIARRSCGDGTLRRRREVNARKSTASDKILNGIKYQNTASVETTVCFLLVFPSGISINTFYLCSKRERFKDSFVLISPTRCTILSHSLIQYLYRCRMMETLTYLASCLM